MCLFTLYIRKYLLSLCIIQYQVMKQRMRYLLSTLTYAVMNFRPTPAFKQILSRHTTYENSPKGNNLYVSRNRRITCTDALSQATAETYGVLDYIMEM